MSHAVEFIETSFFTTKIQQLATDDELKDLQKELIARPEKGVLIQGTGGLRKIRMATGNQGKSGSLRVIYFLANRDVIYLIMVYPKGQQDNLSVSEKAVLKKLTQVLKAEV